MMSYAQSPSWTRYRDILAAEAGIAFPREPSEAWTEVRGHSIHLDIWEPGGEPRGTIILVHGGGGNGRVLAPFASALASKGWRVLAPDLPGYGLTTSPKESRWDYHEWPEVVASLAIAHEACGLMGFSVGGMTAVFAAERSGRRIPVVATTLLDTSNPNLFVHSARWRFVGSLSLLGFRFVPWLVDRLRLPLSLAAPLLKMSANRSLAAYFRTDRLLGRRWVSVRFFHTMHRYAPTAPAFDFPVLLAHPGEDEWTPAEWSTAWLAASPIVDSEVVVTRTGSHLPVEPESFEGILKAADDFFLRHVGDSIKGADHRSP